MIQRFFQLAALWSLLMVLTSPAQAAADAQGAQTVRGLIQQSLDRRTAMLTQQDTGVRIEWKGEMSVQPNGDYYAVRLPHMTMHYPDQSRLEVGVVAMNVALDPGDMLRGSISLPTPMTLSDSKGAALFTIAIGKQKLAGIWDPQTDIFKALDSAYENISLTDTTGAFVMNIGAIKAVADLKENPDKTLSGPTDALLRDISLQSVENGITVNIAKVVVKSTIESLNLQLMRQFQQEIAQHTKNLQDPALTEDARNKIGADVSARMLDYFGKISDGFSSHMAMTGFSFDRQSAQDRTQFKIASLTGQSEMRGIKGDKASGRLGVNLTGLEGSSFPAAYADIIPREMNIDVRTAQIPFQQILVILVQAAQKSLEATGATDSQAATDAAAALPTLLGQAGSTLDITNTYLKTSLTEARIEGNAQASPTAALGGTGTFVLTMTGLDELIAKLQELSKKPEQADNKGIQQVIMGLSMMQMMGQSGTSADGKAQRSFKLEITADGKRLMNGLPMGMPGSAPSATPVAPAAP